MKQVEAAAYMIGVPGAGKSTLVRLTTANVKVEWERSPFGHGVYRDDDGKAVAVQLGGDHGTFPGTDRLSMSVLPLARDWLGMGLPARRVFAEGDRLAVTAFFEELERAAEHFTVVWLDTPAALVEARRAERGTDADPTWLRSRTTKVQRLAERWSDRIVRIDGTWPMEEQVAAVLRLDAFVPFRRQPGAAK